MRPLILITVLILIPLTQALGQVAVPGLQPFANPATLSWELSPFISGTLLKIDQTATRNTKPALDRQGDGSGYMLRARSPGETIGYGFYYLDASLDLGDTSTGTIRQGLRTLAFGFSIAPSDQIALGAGGESHEEYENSGGTTRTVGTQTYLVGGSIQLAGWFFLGSVHGQRTLVSDVPEEDGQTRSISRYGMAGRWLWETGLLHLEYYHQEMPPFREVAYPGSPFTSDELDTEVDAFIAEAVIFGLILGSSLSVTEILGDLLKNETTRTEISLIGLMLPEGPSATLVNRMEETTNRRTNTDDTREVTALVVAWRF